MLDAELAILSIIAEAPAVGRVGRDVQEIIDERNLRLWTMIGVESIYYIIEKLEQQGLITNVDKNPPQDRQWRVYRVTSAGWGVLQTSVTDLLASARQVPTRFEIGLANILVLKTSQVKHALLNYRAELAARRDALKAKQQQLDASIPFHIVSMFRHQEVLLEAEIGWFDGWFEQWEAQAPPDREESIRAPMDIPRMEQVILPQDPDSLHQRPTRKHEKPDEAVDFPPPPRKRSNPHHPPTQVNNPTPQSLKKRGDG